MQYGTIPGLAKPVSRIVQGCIMLNPEDEAANHALLDAVFEAGVNAFDNAHVYGNGDTERVFGRWVASRGIRDKVVLLDKGAHHNADRKRVTPYDIEADIHDSLARLKFDHIDLYALHRDDPSVPVGPIVESLQRHKAAGLIGPYGGSNWRADRVAAANDYARAHGLEPFAFSSPHFSLAEMVEAPWDDCISITGAHAAEQDWYSQEMMPVFSWSTLAGGWFSGRLSRANQAEHTESLHMHCYGCEANLQRLERAEQLGKERGLSPAQMALAYVLNQHLNAFPLVAAFDSREIKELAAAVEVALTPQELSWLDLRSDYR
jgi:aryl-alcohol dehydrogenase-like predicted oxidoreductase